MENNSVKRELKKERFKQSFQLWAYSVQRMDFLIISICGAGIYSCLETLKYAFENNINNTWALKLSGGLFIISIAINFISQLTGKKANYYDMIFCETFIESSLPEPTEEEKSEINKFDEYAEMYSVITRKLNVTSIILMLVAISSITGYYAFTF